MSSLFFAYREGKKKRGSARARNFVAVVALQIVFETFFTSQSLPISSSLLFIIILYSRRRRQCTENYVPTLLPDCWGSRTVRARNARISSPAFKTAFASIVHAFTNGVLLEKNFGSSERPRSQRERTSMPNIDGYHTQKAKLPRQSRLASFQIENFH